MPAARLSCGLALFAALLAAPCSAGAAPQVVGAIALQDPTRWDYVSVDAPAYRLYVAHRELEVGEDPGEIVYDPATRRVFAFNGRSNDVSVADVASLEVLAPSIQAGGAPEFDCLPHEPSSGQPGIRDGEHPECVKHYQAHAE
jgi:YVTN family beta-propeller protein